MNRSRSTRVAHITNHSRSLNHTKWECKSHAGNPTWSSHRNSGSGAHRVTAAIRQRRSHCPPHGQGRLEDAETAVRAASPSPGDAWNTGGGQVERGRASGTRGRGVPSMPTPPPSASPRPPPASAFGTMIVNYEDVTLRFWECHSSSHAASSSAPAAGSGTRSTVGVRCESAALRRLMESRLTTAQLVHDAQPGDVHEPAFERALRWVIHELRHLLRHREHGLLDDVLGLEIAQA